MKKTAICVLITVLVCIILGGCDPSVLSGKRNAQSASAMESSGSAKESAEESFFEEVVESYTESAEVLAK